MFNKLLLFLCVFMLSTITVFASPDRYQWIDSNDKVGYFFDTQTIKYSFSTYTGKPDTSKIDVWIKTVYTNDGVQGVIEERTRHQLPTDGFENLSYTLSHYKISRDNKISILEILDYDIYGNTLDTLSIPAHQQEWKDVVPDSVGELWHQHVWKYSYIKANSLLMEIRSSNY